MENLIEFRIWDGKHMDECPDLEELVRNYNYDYGIIGARDKPIFLQYIGIKDSLGYKIFEGDILYWEHRNQWYKVFRVEGGFAVNTHQDDFYKNETPFFYEGLSHMQNASWVKNLEKKGNIFENQTLLIK